MTKVRAKIRSLIQTMKVMTAKRNSITSQIAISNVNKNVAKKFAAKKFAAKILTAVQDVHLCCSIAQTKSQITASTIAVNAILAIPAMHAITAITAPMAPMAATANGNLL